MKRRFFVLAAALVLVMFAAGSTMAADQAKPKDAAKAQQPGDLFVVVDTDKDGKISKVEYITYTKDQVRGEKEFKVLDKNGDSFLVKEEFTVTKLPKETAPAKAAPKTAK